MGKQRLQLILVASGFATFLAMNSFSLWGFSSLPQSLFGEIALPFWITPLSISNVITFFVYFIGSARLPKAFSRAPFPEALMLLSVGMIFLLGYFLSENLGMLAFAGICVGIGTTCCFICWEKIFSASSQHEAQKQILLGSVLSLVPFALFSSPDQSFLLFGVAFLIFFNLLFLYLCLRLFGSAMPAGKDFLSNKGSYRAVHRQLWKPLLCIIMIGIISPVLGSVAFTDELSFADHGLFVHGANLLAAIVLFVVWVGMKRKLSISQVYVVIFPILITAFLVFPFLQERYRIIVLFVGSFGFSLFSIVMMISSIQIAAANNISLVYIYTLFAGVTYASRFLGDGLAETIAATDLSQETQIVTSVFVLLYGCSLVMFLLVRKNASQKQPPAHPGGTDLLSEQCRILAQEHRLSKRQAEVLDLLVHGYDVPSIAEKLFISKNTVRTHTKKIYAAFDVHSRKELVDMANSPK